MHRTTPWASLAALGLLAVGCGTDSGDAAPTDESGDGAGDPAAEETVFDDMLETQDRARAVEDLNDERRELLESAIEAGEGAPASDEDVPR
jgi:hypothetical protein